LILTVAGLAIANIPEAEIVEAAHHAARSAVPMAASREKVKATARDPAH
jgi:hypothetical protein